MTPFDRLVVAKSGISLEEAKKVLHRHKVEKLPIIDDQRKIVGLITIKDIKSVVEFPNASRDSKGRLMVAGAVGTSDDTMERVRALIAAGVDAIVVDTAHGHSKNVVNRVAEIKRLYPQMQVIAGNIATYEAALSLHQAGADAVKVGIGPGSICTTRIVAGVGVPQLSAIFDCAKASRELDLPIIADGGIRYSGDIAKALAAGASTVMIGSIFAGAEESPGETIIYDGRTFKAYRGMGSIGAMQAGSSDRYNQFGINAEKLVPEGVEGMLPFKGRVSDIVYQLCGGLRSGMGYCGAATIPQLQQNARFVRITPAGMKESRPHDISITKESPNYRFQI
jgi:IMP dehydrogenase